MNRRGAEWGPIILGGILILGLVLFSIFYDGFTLTPDSLLNQNTYSFNYAFGGTNGNLEWLDYVFGVIPANLADTVNNEISAGIVIIAMWLIFLLVFVDIFRMFSFFSQPVNVLTAVLLTVISANIHGISFLTSYFLAVFAILGSFSIIAGIGFALVLGFLFHFGGQGIRDWIQNRRLGDETYKATIGAARAAAGVEAAAAIGAAAGRAGK